MKLDTYHQDKGQKMALRLKIKARRIQEMPRFGEFCGGKIAAAYADVNKPLTLSLCLSVMRRKFSGLGLVS
jgi:hypothetical protein